MRNNVKRYAIMMALGIVLNLAFYNVAHTFHLPAWLDNLGTVYVAFLLEPAAGLLVAFATNFYEAAFIYDSSSLVYYATSASIALIIGIGMRRQGKITWKKILLVFLMLIVIPTIVAGGITIWRTNGVPDSAWERQFYEMALANNIPNVLACMFGTLVLKVVDALVIIAALPIFYFLTPKKFINTNNQDVVSWKIPYFKRQHK